MSPLLPRLASLIAAEGPLPVSQFMAACLFDPKHGYYARGARLGADFTTAPEISQMFGELVGLWLAQSWLDLGAPDPFHLIELGPGRGLLMADAWRATASVAGFQAAARLWLVEASLPLRAQQQTRLGSVGALPGFLDRLEQAPIDAPTLLIANEFLDCLPIRQFVRTTDGWRERLVGLDAEGQLAFGLSATPLASDGPIPPPLRNAALGAVAEVRPAAEALMADLGQRLRHRPGHALLIDYGPAQSETGDTLQAIEGGRKVSPLASPGLADLTARVDFATLAAYGRREGLRVAGPSAQGQWLRALGIDVRAARLAASRPQQAGELQAALARLTEPAQMGDMFQVLCCSSPNAPFPAGF